MRSVGKLANAPFNGRTLADDKIKVKFFGVECDIIYSQQCCKLCKDMQKHIRIHIDTSAHILQKANKIISCLIYRLIHIDS